MSEAEVTDLVAYQIGKVALRPGDILVVKVAGRISREMADQLQKHMRAVIGDQNKMIVLDGDLDLAVLTREHVERMTGSPA